jgi:Flp pilus assembly protein TadG
MRSGIDSAWTALIGFAVRFGADRRGLIALKFALALPAVGLLTVGSIDLVGVHASKGRLQDIADAAALAGANELGLAIDDTSAIERAGAYVASHLSEWPTAPNVTPRIQVIEREQQRIIEVVLDSQRDSFFGNMLPPGGWKFTATSSAVSVAMTPLCVLVTGTSKSKTLNIKDQGQLKAPACLVHSNHDIRVEGGQIAAAQVQAVTEAEGAISPTAGTGAAEIEDPFEGMNLATVGACSGQKKVDVTTGTISLPPGVHCEGFIMGGNSKLVLQAGEHWFRDGALVIKENATLTGTDVVLLFNKDSKFEFKDSARVSLDGRKSGAYAGMVMVGMRDNTQDFVITSDNVDNLLGVIYVPEAVLIVEGKADVARDSAWTVIVAHMVQLKGSPSVIINADYGASPVPVPDGVGPRGGGSRLVQ